MGGTSPPAPPSWQAQHGQANGAFIADDDKKKREKTSLQNNITRHGMTLQDNT